MKTQLVESRLKCDLLEQSLRVIAQENHDLEAGKLTPGAATSDRNRKESASAAVAVTETNTNNDDDSYEEFFDIRNICFYFLF